MLKFIIASLAVISTPLIADAQNLLANPEFETDILGWGTATGSFTWSTEDWEMNPASGSAIGSNYIEFGAAIGQCLPASELTLYTAGASFRRLTGVSADTAEVQISFYANPGCASAYLGGSTSSRPLADTWGAVSTSAVSPAGTQSVIFQLWVPPTSPADQILIDHAVVAPGLFWDTFESGDSSRWSDVVGLGPVCAHDICIEGGPLTPACDSCVAAICAVDSFCCDTTWDGKCVAQVFSVCGTTCP